MSSASDSQTPKLRFLLPHSANGPAARPNICFFERARNPFMGFWNGPLLTTVLWAKRLKAAGGETTFKANGAAGRL